MSPTCDSCGGVGEDLVAVLAARPDIVMMSKVAAPEQLRALEHGFRIAVRIAPEPFPGGVDTAEDLERVEKILTERI